MSDGTRNAPVAPDPARGLPKPLPKYANRRRELDSCDALLRSFLDGGQGGVVLIQGMSEIGKSVFQAEVALRNASAFTDTIHVPLNTYRDVEGNTDYAAAMDHILRELSVPPAVRSVAGGTGDGSVTDHQWTVLAAASRARTILLTLDDVMDYEELRLLASPPGRHVPLVVLGACAAEFRGTAAAIDKAGAEIVVLEEFPDDDGLALLRSFTPVAAKLDQTTPERQERLLALCQGLPAVLRVVAVHLAEQYTLSVDAFIDAVHAHIAEDPGLAPAEAAVQVGMGALDSRQQAVLRQWAAYPGLVKPADLAASIVGAHAGDVVGELKQTGLLRSISDSDDLEILGLVQQRARLLLRKLPPEELHQLYTSVVKFATVTHRRGDQLVGGDRLRFGDGLNAGTLAVPAREHRFPFTRASEAANWQDLHLSQIPALMQLAVEKLYSPATALLLAESVWPVCYTRGRLNHASVIFDAMGAIAAAEGYDVQLAQARCYQARVNILLGRLDAAQAQVEAARQLSDQLAGAPRSVALRAVVCETYGLTLSSDGRESDAVGWIAQARELHRELDRPRGFVMQTCQLADLRISLGQHTTVRAELAEAEEIALRHHAAAPRDWDLRRARISVTLAETYLASGEIDAAATQASWAQDIYLERQEPVREARALRLLERIAELRGDAGQHGEVRQRQRRIFEHYHMDAHAQELRERTG